MQIMFVENVDFIIFNKFSFNWFSDIINNHDISIAIKKIFEWNSE